MAPPLGWLKRRGARRRAERDAKALWARDATFAVVRDLAAPLVEKGLARLEWTEPDPDEEWLADGEATLVPRNDAAAKIVVNPGPGIVTLLVGPRGNAHELVIDDDGVWERELRACLEAVIDGRYRESAAPGTVSRQVVTITFEMPDRRDVVVKHYKMFELDPGEKEPPPERRFAGYA